jgi:hypothetical protein
MGAGTTNLPLQLLDWLFWPRDETVRRLAPLMAVFRPGRQYVGGVHMRTGGADGGIGNDATIAPPEAVGRVAPCCVAAAVHDLASAFGPRDEVLLLVFSDNAGARVQVKASLRGTALSGMPVRVVDWQHPGEVMHTDPSLGRSGTGEAHDALRDTVLQMFLLSATHAMVRSRSGYSEVAQAWGRVPVVYQMHFSSQRCIDVSREPLHSMGTWERRV